MRNRLRVKLNDEVRLRAGQRLKFGMITGTSIWPGVHAGSLGLRSLYESGNVITSEHEVKSLHHVVNELDTEPSALTWNLAELNDNNSSKRNLCVTLLSRKPVDGLQKSISLRLPSFLSLSKFEDRDCEHRGDGILEYKLIY